MILIFSSTKDYGPLSVLRLGFYLTSFTLMLVFRGVSPPTSLLLLPKWSPHFTYVSSVRYRFKVPYKLVGKSVAWELVKVMEKLSQLTCLHLLRKGI